MQDNIRKKLETRYAVKTIPLEIKDIDESSRIVKGYFSSFNVIDSDRDVIRSGAFTKSIKEKGPDSLGRRIAHLRNHGLGS